MGAMLPSTETPLVHVLAVVVVIQVVAAAWLTVRQRRRDGGRRGGPDADAEGGVTRRERREGHDGHRRVVCPHCGARNDPDYTFCRECVRELVAATPDGAGGDALVNRSAR